MQVESYEKRVLICEDEPTTAFCIQKIIDKMGYKSDIAYTAKEAQELLNINEYHLMTLDIMLPDKNGLDLLNEIKANEATKDLPVIIVSAYEKDKTDEDIKNKIVYWVEKSFDQANLNEAFSGIAADKPKGKSKLPYVEDDEDLLNVIALTLSNVADITTAKNVSEAQEALDGSIYDIIILDYKLPDGTCEQIVDNIKASENKNAKMVLFSAYETEKAFSSQFDKVIMKTKISTEEFINCIKEL